MKTALDAVAAAWKANSGKTASIVYASSAVLAKQIEQGAPADLFISADLQWMDYLEKAKFIRAGTRHNLLGNELVQVEPSDAHSKLKIAQGLISRGPQAMAKSQFAPLIRVRAESTQRKLSKIWGSLGVSNQSSRRRTISAVL